MKQHMASVRLQLEDGINIMPAPVPSDQGGTTSMPLPACHSQHASMSHSHSQAGGASERLTRSAATELKDNGNLKMRTETSKKVQVIRGT